MRSFKSVSALAILLLVPPAPARTAGAQAPVAAGAWTGADGTPVPLRTYDELVQFLQTATVKSTEPLSEGVTKPYKVLLEKDGIRLNAIFRYSRDKHEKVLPSGRRLTIRDDYIFEPAAYELAVLLGLDSVPPAVVRGIDGRQGSLQAWVENTIMEKTRLRDGIQAPDEQTVKLQYQVMAVFDNLICNEDRNRGNILFDRSWKLWMIDHTRAFRDTPELPYPRTIQQCEETLWDRLRRLRPKSVRSRLGKLLEPAQLDAQLERREALVEHIEQLIEEEGRENVLFSLTSTTRR